MRKPNFFFHRLLHRLLNWFEQSTVPFPAREPTSPPTSLFRFCVHYAQSMKGMLALMTALTISIAILEVSLYGYLGDLVDWLATKDRATFFQTEWPTLVSMSLLVLIVLPLLIFFHSTTVHQGLLGNFPMAVRWLSHRYLLKQSIEFYQEEFAGRIATKVMQTALATREATMKVLDIMIYITVYFLAMLIIVAQFNLLLMLPLLCWLVVYIALQCVFVPKLRAIASQQANARADMTGRIVDSYTNIHTVKLFAHTDAEAKYANQSMQSFLDTVYKQMRLVTGVNVLVQLSNYVLLFSITGMGLWLWSTAAISIGAIAVAVSLSLRLNGMSQWIMWELSTLFEHIGTLADGVKTLSQPLTVQDAPEAKPLQTTHGKIEFRNVFFQYNDENRVFSRLSLTLKAGEKVGIVGRSGAGKSTLVNLLLRLHDIQDGSILIDDQNIASVTQESLRANIGMVTQDTSLLHRSVRENILYGNPSASDAEVLIAAQKSEADRFIQALSDPKGNTAYDAQVGERGVKLSGGQRQRIAIARVLIKNAPILILDEATSALDSEVESAIQSNLNHLMEGKTVIAIAHRLSTIAKMDRLIVLEGGDIVEEGTHQALIEQQGLYAQLWSLQSGGFLAGE